MNKPQTSTKSQGPSRSQRSFSHIIEVDLASCTTNRAETTKPATFPAGTINFSLMAEDADRINDHVAKGGKPDELSGIKFFKPTGLFSK